MSQPISNVVQISITRETQVVKKANFGTILLVDEIDTGDSPPFLTRTKEYAAGSAGLAELAADGYSLGDYVYDAAVVIFSQNPSVDKLKVGMKKIVTDADASWNAALVAIRAFDSDWYGFSIKSTVEADQEEAADWAETAKVICALRTADTTVITVTETDIAFYISNNNLDRSFCVYDPENEYIECAMLAERFPYDPGEGTWKFKTLASIASYDLTSSERGYALAKNCNLYIDIAGIDMIEEGQVGSGEFIDVMRGVDWLESHIQETIFAELVNVQKIPYTDAGVTLVDGLLREALTDGTEHVIATGFITEVPVVSSVSVIDRGNRLLPDVKFTATPQGAIHKTNIAGIVSI